MSKYKPFRDNACQINEVVENGVAWDKKSVYAVSRRSKRIAELRKERKINELVNLIERKHKEAN